MRTILLLNNKPISAKKVKDLIGEETYKRMLDQAKQSFREDPLICNDFYLGAYGVLNFEFKL